MVKGPEAADLTKIHNEINQIGNQRFILTTVSITFIGGLLSWVVPKASLQGGDYIADFNFWVCGVGNLVLLSLFWWNHNLRKMARIYSNYLIISGKSQWEEDWAKFRSKPYSAQTKPQALMFLALSIVTTGFPFLVAFGFDLQIHEPGAAMLPCLCSGVVTCVLVYGMGFHNWFINERDIKTRWESV
ncbi:hypothetical protein GVN24_15955 [Rhizobium sp. CRIBSB]|nr:hypothetical protein [Rhizobium sp. CRIBSB]